jgi:hypothetical protein
VNGAIYARWMSLGGDTGLLGLPTSNEQYGSRPASYAYSTFQRGAIYAWLAGVFEVHGDIYNAWQNAGGATGALGLPITEEHTSSGNPVSVFQQGYVDCTPQHGCVAHPTPTNPPPIGTCPSGPVFTLLPQQLAPLAGGYQPYAGSLGLGVRAGSKLSSITVPASLTPVVYRFVKSGHSFADLDNADAYVQVAPGGSPDLTELYGQASPSLPVPLACAVGLQPGSTVPESLPLSYQYTYPC